ncbi:hypothetical protein [Shinella zoogloeoides]
MARPLSALDLFRAGNDTMQIAARLSISEEEALEQVSSQRSASLRLPSPYPIHPDAKPTGWPKGKVAYAGRH